MADMTNVDASKLRQSASKIGNLSGELSGIVNKIKDCLTGLSKSWQSEAATEFMKNWQSDEEALREMADQYHEIMDLMNELAQDFEASEGEVQGLVGKLRI